MRTMDGWLFQLLKTNHRCWFVRGCSIIIASLLCMSCGKKIEDKNHSKVKANKTNIIPQESPLNILLKDSSDGLSGNHYIQERFFFEIPEVISSSLTIEGLTIFFNVIDDTYEYFCDYIQEEDKLVFEKCTDDQGYLIEHLIPGERVHLPADRDLYLTAKSTADQVEITLNVINK